MCIDILRNPVKSLLDAKKKRNMKKTALVLIEESILFALATGILVAKTGFYDVLLIMSMAAIFFVALVGVLLFGLVIHVISTTLGGKGRYFEGLTAVVYSVVPISVGVFIVSLLALVPLMTLLQVIVLALTFALGFSMFYRAIKELYSTDMITSFVAASVAVMVVLVAVYATLGLTLLNRLATAGVF